jgi:guanine nucleotide-binding protein G(I)/G(S)/G(T) subunit beta-1
MQARIQQARREAETLKDKIKRKKDELADTTRTLTQFNALLGLMPSRARH